MRSMRTSTIKWCLFLVIPHQVYRRVHLSIRIEGNLQILKKQKYVVIEKITLIT